MLLQKGAEIDAIPPGFDYAGTALHNAAVRGHRAVVEFLLEQGANPNVKDQKVTTLLPVGPTMVVIRSLEITCLNALQISYEQIDFRFGMEYGARVPIGLIPTSFCSLHTR